MSKENLKQDWGAAAQSAGQAPAYRNFHHKKFRKILGAAAAGMLFLTGCGDGQTDGILSVRPTEIDGTGTSGGQGGQEENGEHITLTLGVLGYSTVPMMQYVVETYNAQSEKYYVEMVEYAPEFTDYEAAQDRFRMALATGKGTDIILYGNDMSADELGYAGVVLDLNSFLTVEDKEEKYLGNILECGQTENALYEISPAFGLGFIAGDGALIGMENGWTVEEMLKSFERNGRDGTALAKGQGRTVVRLMEASMEDYVDWDTGTADFCKEEFYRVLEFGKAFDKSEWIRPTRESVASGTHLASCEGVVGVTDIQYLEWLFGDNMVVKGYPCSHGTGVAVNIRENSMGICSYSRCPEGAWDFLEFYVQADWTEGEYDAGGEPMKGKFSHYFIGLPVSRRLFEKMLAESMIQEYFPDTGEPIPLNQREDGAPSFYANTAEDVEKLREVIALADRRYYPAQSEICQIIAEEIGGYNSGAISAEQTAAKIQNRVQLYLDERK